MMASDAIVWMAWVVVVLSLVKLAVLAVRPRVWVGGVAKAFYGHASFGWLSFALAVVGLYYLNQVLTIVEIFAAIFVTMFLFSLSLRPYAKEMIAVFERSVNERTMWRKSWFTIVIWLALIGWAITALV